MEKSNFKKRRKEWHYSIRLY